MELRDLKTFDDLRTEWQKLDQRLDTMEDLLRVGVASARSVRLDRTRSQLRKAGLVLWYELAMGLLAVLLVGSYLGDLPTNPRFLLPAVLLHLMAIGVLGSAAYQLVRVATVDFARPIVETQRDLASLRVVRARVHRGILFAAPLLWALLVVVVPHALVGLDVYRAFGAAWVGGNLAVGVVFLAMCLWLARLFPDSSLLHWLSDDLTGKRLAEASASLGEIEEFKSS